MAFGGGVVVGGDVKGFAVEFFADVALFDEDAARFDDVAREREHRFLVLVRGVDGDVGVGSRAEVAFVFESQNAGGTGTGDDGDVVEGVGAFEVGQLRAFEDGGMNCFQSFFAVGAVHEQPDDLRIGQKGAPIGMVGAHHDPPGILHHEVPFETDGPLQAVNETFVFVFDGSDAATGFHFGVGAEPFALIDVGQIVTEWAVAGHARGFAEEHLADIDGDVFVGVHVLGQRGDFAVKGVFIGIAAAVAVKLNVCHVAAMAFERTHRFERRGPVAGHAQVVAVDMGRVR